MIKVVSGFCPEYDIQNSIEIEYIKCKAITNSKTSYVKGRLRYCEKANSQGCNLDHCPIHSQAPKVAN